MAEGLLSPGEADTPGPHPMMVNYGGASREQSGRWSTILAAARGMKKEAHLLLFREFASGLRLMLRRQVSCRDLEATIDQVVCTVIQDLQSRRESPEYCLLGKIVHHHARELVPMNAPRIWDIGPSGDASFLDRFSTQQRAALRLRLVERLDEDMVRVRTQLGRVEQSELMRAARESGPKVGQLVTALKNEIQRRVDQRGRNR